MFELHDEIICFVLSLNDILQTDLSFILFFKRPKVYKKTADRLKNLNYIPLSQSTCGKGFAQAFNCC